MVDFSVLAAATPNVSLKSEGPGQTEIELRGMASSGGNSPTVGFYLDDTPLTAPASAQNGKVVINPTSTTWLVSRCCAGRRARCTARARWAARCG